MATEFWYNDGSAWRKVKEFYYNDGTAWRNIKEAWYNDGTAWRKFFTQLAGTVSLSGLVDQDDLKMGPGTSGAGLWFYSDGTVQNYKGLAQANWFSPTTAGAGASYWMRITLLSGGPLDTNSASTWTSLSSTPSCQIFVTRTNYGTAGKTASIRIEISTTSNGSNIIATRDLNLSCFVDNS